jgi:hypothetical protein
MEQQEQFVKTRIKELTKRAESQGINWKAKTKQRPQDDIGLLMAALATLLGVSVIDVFDERLSMGEIQAKAKLLAQHVETRVPEIRKGATKR